MIDQVHKICWAAGLLEGEGHFGLRHDGTTLIVEIGMTDKDVIDKFHSIFNYWGSRNERILPSGKTFYSLKIAGQQEAQEVMEAVLPFMGERRTKQIQHCLDERAKQPPNNRDKLFCKSGHPLHGDNLKIIREGKYIKRRCIACANARSAKYRASLTAATYVSL